LERRIERCRQTLNDGFDEVGKDRSDGLTGVPEEVDDEVTKEKTSRFGLARLKQTSDDGKGRVEAGL
jgi:hypothetical protein